MASDNEASCVSDPNFAVICSFLECFGKSCGINYPDIAKLQEMLEDAHEVPQQLVELHVKLLRKLRKTVTPEKWERSLVKFCHTYSNQDGWELERFGYKKARIGVKLRLLKVLLEAQFDLNSRFKLEVNKLAANELRVEPLGRDKTGLAYWFQLDEECNMRVYREDLDEENWELVARDREGVVNLINSLSDGEAVPIPINDESSNSLEISEKPIIDTGQVEESTSPDEDTKLETAIITNDTEKTVNEVSKITDEKISDMEKVENVNLVKNVAEHENIDEEGEEEEDEEDDDEEEEEEGEDDDEEVSNEESSKANSDEEDEDDEDDDDDEEEDEDSQELKATQNQTFPIMASSKIVENKVPLMTIQAKQNIIEKQQRTPWKTSQYPTIANPHQTTKSTTPRLNIVESTHVKSIETPVITSPLKLVNIQDLQNPVEDRGHARDDKYPIKSALPFQSSDSPTIHARNSIKPIDKLAANLSRIQSEKLEKPGAAKLLEKIAENLARSSVAQGNLANGDDEKVQEFLARTASEKSTITIVPSRGQRGMDLSTSPRGWETTSDHARPMDYSGIDLSSRKVTKPADLHSSAYRSQDFQHREMDLSTRKIVKTDMASMPYDSRTVILRNHANTTMVTDLSKKQIPYSGYDLPQSTVYHSGTRIMGKDDSHRLPNYTILPDPSKIASMRMAGGALKRPLEHVDDSQQEILKRMRQEGITLRGPIDKRSAVGAAPIMASHRRDEIVGAAIEEPVMMIQGEGSGSDCDAVNPIIGDEIEEPIIFFYGTGAGRDCDTGNPGDETSSDKKESNESKKEGCGDVTTSLTTSKMLSNDESINETSSDDDKSLHRINTNYSQSTADIGPSSDHCQSTVVSSVSTKEKFKPTLGIQVIARTSGSLTKKSSRWDVGRPEDKAECDSSIVTSDQHISTANESIIDTRNYENMDTERLASTDECVVESKNESDDITSTSNQTFGTSKIAECTSSYDILETDQIPSIQPDSSFVNEPTSANDCKSREKKIVHIEQCDSSVVTAIPSSSLDQGESVESTMKEESNLDNVETCVLSKHERDEQTGSTNDSPPRFFFGPNCVSYSSKADEARLSQVVGTSFNTPENAEVAKNNNNFVKAAETHCSESSSGSCESNIEARLKNVEITEDKGQLECSDEIQESVKSPIRSECRVQSSTSPEPKDKNDCIVTPESMNISITQEENEKTMEESVTQSVDVDEPTKSSHTEIPTKSETDSGKLDVEAPETIESSTDHETNVEAAKIPDVETSSSISIVENTIEVDTKEKDVKKDDEIPAKDVPSIEIAGEAASSMKINAEIVRSMEINVEAVPSMDINAKVVPSMEINTQVISSMEISETQESESNNRCSESNDHIPETTDEEVASSALQVTPDDSSQTIETNDDEKHYENKELELSSDLDDKTKQSMESEDDSMANSVEKINEDKNTNNELCNEDAQDGFSKSSEINEETKDETVESRSNIVEARRSEHINEERSEMSVELPEDSSGDSVAPSSSSLAANPSGEDSTISEICENLSLAENSGRNSFSLEDKVAPAPIVDANISKSPERITIESQKASSSTRLLDSMDVYTDDLSENPSSADQDSNEAMVIDDGPSDSNDSTRETSGMKETSSDLKALNFKDKVSEMKPIVDKSEEKIEAACSGENFEIVSRETSSVDPLENVTEAESEQSEKNQSCADDDKKILVDSRKDEISSSKDEENISSQVISEIGEKKPENFSETSKIKDTNFTVSDADEKSTTVPHSSLVPNYDCSDDDEVSDDVFEMEAAEIENLMDQIDAEDSPSQTADEVTRLPEVPEVKSSEVADVKIDENKRSIEFTDETIETETRAICENDNKISEYETVAEKTQIDHGTLKKNIETEENLVVDEKLKISSQRIEPDQMELETEEKTIEPKETEKKEVESKKEEIETEEEIGTEGKDVETEEKVTETEKKDVELIERDRLKAIDDLTDSANEIAKKSCDLTVEIESTSTARDLTDVSEKMRHIEVEEILTTDSSILTKVSNAIDEIPKDMERVNECREVVKNESPTKESSKLSDVPVESANPGERAEESPINQSIVTNYDNEGKIERSKDFIEKIEQERPSASQGPKAAISVVDSMNDEIHARLETSDKSENVGESKSLPVEEKEDKLEVPEEQDIPVLPVEQEIPILPVEQNIPVLSVEQEIPVLSIESKVPDKINTQNALSRERSHRNDEKITTLKSSLNVESNSSSENTINTSENPNESFTSSNTPVLIREDISDVLSLKNDSKKEASKRLHGITDTDYFPPTKSRPSNVDFAKDHTENRVNDEKVPVDDKKIIEGVSAPSQVVTAFSSIVSPSEKIPTAILQPEIDLAENLKNHEVPEIRENDAKPAIQVEAPIEQRSSEIQSVDIKCIDLESDDSMGIDNESMFDTPADDIDPLACTEADLTKPTSLEESSVPKIGIRVKPVADLVYEGWKLDSPEPPAAPVPSTVSRKRRNSNHESNSEDTAIKIDDDAGEAGGKRMKLRGKRSPDMKLRKSVEANRPEPVSSEDETSKAQTTVETIEIKDNDEEEEEVVEIAKIRNERKPRGRPKGRRRRGNRSFPRAAARAKVTENKNDEPTAEVPAAVPVTTPTDVGQPESKKKRKKRKMVLGLEIGIDIAVPDSQGGTGTDEIPVRQSRRIAQLKIKEEADKRRIEEETMSDPKDKKDRDGTEKKKRKKQKPDSEDEPVMVVKEIEREVKSRKQRKKKKMSSTFNEAKPWQSSSGSSSDDEGPEEDEDEEIESEGSLLFKSDHEFSPESDLEKDDESAPLRRARTAQKAQSDVEDADDEYACQKCGKVDHPEWILLCDTCDKGWHCSCLRPALMLIPEGDWFCPPCQHTVLVNKLRDSLKTFDQNSKKHENEVLRKKRLAFVGISLDNVLHKSERADNSSGGSSRGSNNDSSSSSSESSSSSSSSEESEPVYQLRERRCANTYKFNEYDDMINAAIQDEVDAVQGAGNQGRGKDIATIVNAEKEEAQAEALKSRQLNQDDEDDEEDAKKSEKESDEDYKVDKDDADDDEEDQRRKPSGKKMLSRKKHRKLNSLDISSEDDPDSDEDFKGSSSDEEDDFDEQLDSSDDSFARSKRRGRKGEARPVRRSTRAARTRYDADFIDDDSDDSDRPKRKKSRSVWEGSESEESDNSWRQRKKKSKTVPAPRLRATSKTKSRKKKKRKRIIVDSDNASDDNEETAEVKNEDEPEDAEAQPQTAEINKEDTENAENLNTTGENHEEEPQDEETNCESTQIEVEHQRKKKKESTPKQKKAPGIRRKIIYGGLDDDGPRQEEETLARRTRGRKINYQDIMGSDSEEELKKVLRKTEESEEEFVVNEGEEFIEDAEKDSDSGDIYSPKKELPKGKAKSPKKMKKSPGGRKSLTDNGTPKQRKKPGPKPGSKNKPKDQPALSISPIIKPNDTDSISRGMDMEGSTMSATGSVIGEVPEGSLTGLTPDDINALDDEQLEQMMMEDEEYGRRQLELAAIEIARNKKQEEREAKKLEKARLKALEILAAEQQRDPNAPEGTDGELPKKKKRGRRSKAEILAEQMRRDGVPSLIAGNLLPTAAVAVAAVATAVVTDVTTPMVSPNIVVTTPTLPTVVAASTIIPAAAAAAAVAAVAVETERSPDVGQLPMMMTGPDGQLFSPDGSPMKPKRRGRGKGKKTLALEAARAAEAAAKAAIGADIGQLGITGTDSNPDVKHDDIPNVLPTPGSSTSGSAPPTPPATSLVISQGLQTAQSPNQQQQQHQQQQQQQQQQTVYPSLPPGQQSSVITRMLQSQPVSSTPQSFTAAAAAMGHKYFGGPNAAGQMMPGPRPSNYDMPTRGRIPSPYRQPVPSPMPPHFAAVRSGTPPMRMRVPGSQLYHTPHHPMDPSPSGGGPISINSRDRSSPLGPAPAMIPPAAGSPLAKGGPTPPPPPYVRGGPVAHSRFSDTPQMPPRHQIPQFPTSSPANHGMQQPSPPPNRPSGNFSPYHPPPPPNYHYGAYPPPPPMTTADDAAAYQGSPYSAEHFSTPAESQPQIQPPPPPPQPQPQPQPGPTSQQQQHPNEPGQANKQYDEEGTGEFGGLVSYFSSQREDDLDS